MADIIEAETPAELDAVRMLLGEYKQAVGVDLWFGSAFQRELAELPYPYVSPGGRLVLARDGSEPAGCGALRPIGPGMVEMRRLWVRKPYRKQGLGRTIAETLIASARQAGNRAIRIETLSVMTQAEALFRTLGFVPVPDDRKNPFPGSKLFELKL